MSIFFFFQNKKEGKRHIYFQRVNKFTTIVTILSSFIAFPAFEGLIANGE